MREYESYLSIKQVLYYAEMSGFVSELFCNEYRSL